MTASLQEKRQRKTECRDRATVGEEDPLVLERMATDGALVVAGDIVQIHPTEMEAGLPTDIATEGGTTRHDNTNRQGGDGMTDKRPNHVLERDGEAQKTTTQRNHTNRQEGDGATDGGQRNGQERDGVPGASQTTPPDTIDQAPRATSPT